MMLISIFTEFYQNLLESSWLEALAVITGLLSVWYARKENILVYPTGIISVLIYVYLCFSVKLYADMSINAFYFVMSIYGWVKWSMKMEDNKHRPISRASKKEWLWSVLGLIISFLVLYYVLDHFTDSNVPFWDGLTTAIFIIGMWMMAFKKIENWIFWIVGDLMCVPLFASKGLILTSFQYTVFLGLAVAGYLEWRKRYSDNANSKFQIPNSNQIQNFK
jgi:nicotinamide mononucleotide transporter